MKDWIKNHNTLITFLIGFFSVVLPQVLTININESVMRCVGLACGVQNLLIIFSALGFMVAFIIFGEKVYKMVMKYGKTG
jgi:hypothetical protein